MSYTDAVTLADVNESAMIIGDAHIPHEPEEETSDENISDFADLAHWAEETASVSSRVPPTNGTITVNGTPGQLVDINGRAVRTGSTSTSDGTLVYGDTDSLFWGDTRPTSSSLDDNYEVEVTETFGDWTAFFKRYKGEE
jgi:hypothetical protein